MTHRGGRKETRKVSLKCQLGMHEYTRDGKPRKNGCTDLYCACKHKNCHTAKRRTTV
jgi:hypothetical protein